MSETIYAVSLDPHLPCTSQRKRWVILRSFLSPTPWGHGEVLETLSGEARLSKRLSYWLRKEKSQSQP